MSQTRKTIEVLIVDDSVMNHKVMTLQIKQHLPSHFEVNITHANDGKEGFEQCKKKKFDLIFMDYHMPIMDGVEATKLIREQGLNRNQSESIIVTCSATTSTEKGYEGVFDGANTALSKPLKPKELQAFFNSTLFEDKKTSIIINDQCESTSLRQRHTSSTTNFFNKAQETPSNTETQSEVQEDNDVKAANCCKKNCQLF